MRAKCPKCNTTHSFEEIDTYTRYMTENDLPENFHLHHHFGSEEFEDFVYYCPKCPYVTEGELWVLNPLEITDEELTI